MSIQLYGNRVLMSDEDPQQVGVVPTGLVAFGFETDFGGWLALEQGQGQPVQEGKVLGAVALAKAAVIFAKDHFQASMQDEFVEQFMPPGALDRRVFDIDKLRSKAGQRRCGHQSSVRNGGMLTITFRRAH